MKIHIVRQGETLVYLAKKYNTPLERLLEANPQLSENDSQELVSGSKVRIPTGKIPLSSAKESPTVSVPKAAEEALPKIPNDPYLYQEEDVDDHIPRPPYLTDLEEFLGKTDSSALFDSSFFEINEEGWESEFSSPYVISRAPWEFEEWDYPYYPVTPYPYIQYLAPYPLLMAPAYDSLVPGVSSSYFSEPTSKEKVSVQDDTKISTGGQWLKESSSAEW